MSWKLAQSLDMLRDQIDAAAPSRRKSSDGTIGDAAHSSRSSDHNPDRSDTVRALDITHDPANGVDAGLIAETLVASKDPRISYIIWNKRIVSPTKSPWKWRRYDGKNPHTMHIHISTVKDDALAHNRNPWQLPGVLGSFYNPPTVLPNEKVLDKPLIVYGMEGDDVREIQEILGFTGSDLDGDFGPKTKKAVQKFQRQQGLNPDGRVGQYTWAALLKPKKVAASRRGKTKEKTTMVKRAKKAKGAKKGPAKRAVPKSRVKKTRASKSTRRAAKSKPSKATPRRKAPQRTINNRSDAVGHASTISRRGR
jgi:hypothetical protein